MTISQLPQEYFTFEVTTIAKTTVQQRDLFLAFHYAACDKANGNLKPTNLDDVLQADFIAMVHDVNGNIAGQCLLIKGDNSADKVATYPIETKEENSLIIASLAGKRAMPTLLERLQNFATTENISGIFAKARATNQCAHEIFQAAGYTARGPETMGQDDYESYLYSLPLKKISSAKQAGHPVNASV